MAEHPAAPLLAQDLGRLQHTNNRGEAGMVHIPGFATSAGMSEEQAGETGLLAQAISEAIIETLERKHDYRVIHESEIQAQAEALATGKHAGDLTDEVVLHCNRCRQPVVKVNAAGEPRVHVATMAAGLQAHVEKCR